MRNQLVLALDVGKSKLADLVWFTVEGREIPLDALELQEKVDDVDRMHEVYEGVTHITLSLNLMNKFNCLPLNP